jgi:hypothetical protein
MPSCFRRFWSVSRRQVHTEAVEQALQSGEIRDAATAGEAAEELAEQALAGSMLLDMPSLPGCGL